MDAASSGQPALGVTYGELTESHLDRIVVGLDGVFYLPEGMTCTHPVGTRLKVVYTERDGRKHAKNIMQDRGIGILS
jgi:hypothetical protein